MTGRVHRDAQQPPLRACPSRCTHSICDGDGVSATLISIVLVKPPHVSLTSNNPCHTFAYSRPTSVGLSVIANPRELAIQKRGASSRPVSEYAAMAAAYMASAFD